MQSVKLRKIEKNYWDRVMVLRMRGLMNEIPLQGMELRQLFIYAAACGVYYNMRPCWPPRNKTTRKLHSRASGNLCLCVSTSFYFISAPAGLSNK